MDNLSHPQYAIADAQNLFAKACGADNCKFLVNGSTSGNLIMIMSCLKAKEKILLPRNVHKSVISAVILSGVIPVFVMPEIDKQIEIVNQISFKSWKKAIDDNLDAKAIFIINPTYFGATCDLKRIVKYAHSKKLLFWLMKRMEVIFIFQNILLLLRWKLVRICLLYLYIKQVEV